MAEVTKIRTLHDVKRNFNVDDDYLQSMARQLNEEDRSRIGRFFSGFEIEDWFLAVFGIMPWTNLVHGLSQEQLPSRSKSILQVPDFAAFIETATFKSEPLLIEVKRVTGTKQTLKLRKAQVELTLKYAATLGVPLVYAIYWDTLGVWTMNTPDSFECKSSVLKLSLIPAIELDCSLVFGDVSYAIMKPLARVQIFSNIPTSSPLAVHDSYGDLTSDQVTVNGNQHLLTGIEPAVLDALFAFSETATSREGSLTRIHYETREIIISRLSSWITRCLGLLGKALDEACANASAHGITRLMEQLEIPQIKMYPAGRTPELDHLEALFLRPPEAP